VVPRPIVDGDPAIPDLPGEAIHLLPGVDPKAEMVERLEALRAVPEAVYVLLRDLDQGEIVVCAFEKGDLALASPDRPHPEDVGVKLLGETQVADPE
jgi:hypothetical protein